MIDAEQLHSLLPSEEEVAEYQRRGWYVSQQVLPEDLLDEALYGVERHHAGERDSRLPLSGGYLDWKPEHGDTLRMSDYVSLQNDEIHELVKAPVLGAIAARLSGSRTVRLFHDQLVYKPPEPDGEETVVGWHVDSAYWHTCTSLNLLTAWIPFQDCTVEMGTLTVIDGSHRWKGNQSMATFRERDLDALVQSFRTGGEEVREVPMQLKKGQVSFHHCLTIHGSLPNRSQQPRIALAVHMQDESNRYQEHIDASGRRTVHVNDMLVRKDAEGKPDYADPEICPILWEEDA